MGEQFLTAVAYARSEVLAEVQAYFGLDTDMNVRIVYSAPTYDPERDARMVKSIRPQFVFADPLVPGFSLASFKNIRQDAEEPLVLVGLAPAGSSEFENLSQSGDLDALYPLPLSPKTVQSMDDELPPMFAKVAEGWGKGAFSHTAVDRVAQMLASAPGTPWEKQTIGIWSPKGGAGKTTVALELAVILALLGGRRVALVDANMNGGHIRYRLDIIPKDEEKPGSILLLADAYWNARPQKPDADPRDDPDKQHLEIPDAFAAKIQSFFEPVQSTPQLMVLPGITGMGQASATPLSGRRGQIFITYLLTQLKKQFDFVVVDVGSSVNVGVHAGALRSMDTVLVVCTPDMSSLVDARDGLETHRNNGNSTRMFQLVLNKWQEDMGPGVDLKSAASFVGLTPVGVITDDATDSVVKSQNLGWSYYAQFATRTDNPREVEMTLKGLADLAARFYPPISTAWSAREQLSRPGTKDKKKGLLGGFLKR